MRDGAGWVARVSPPLPTVVSPGRSPPRSDRNERSTAQVRRPPRVAGRELKAEGRELRAHCARGGQRVAYGVARHGLSAWPVRLALLRAEHGRAAHSPRLTRLENLPLAHRFSMEPGNSPKEFRPVVPSVIAEGSRNRFSCG